MIRVLPSGIPIPCRRASTSNPVKRVQLQHCPFPSLFLSDVHCVFTSRVSKKCVPFYTISPFLVGVLHQIPSCPAEPEPDYPKAHFLTAVTENWSTDDTAIPPRHFDELCHFDYQNEEENKKAWAYRQAERYCGKGRISHMPMQYIYLCACPSIVDQLCAVA